MQKYDVWFCRCGTIQLMPNEYYDWLQEDYRNRYIIRVCQNCGATRKIWLEEYEDGFCICGTDANDFELTPDEIKNCRIIFNQGIRVPIEGGTYADYHVSNMWLDNEGHKNVDTKRLIHIVKDEETLRSIAAYVSGIDWTGTPYDYDLLLKGTDEK